MNALYLLPLYFIIGIFCFVVAEEIAWLLLWPVLLIIRVIKGLIKEIKS